MAALAAVPAALACGSNGYTYAGLASPSKTHGVGARLTAIGASSVANGHIAGWVGVGGPGEGPHGSNEWLQVGSAAFPSIIGSDVYYEVARPGRYPTYHQVSAGVAVGTYTKVTVLEMHGRANWWRVWVNHKPVSAPIRLPESRDGLMSIATSESWDGGTGGMCNDFLYRFRHVSIARAPGGDWQQLTSGYPIQSAVSHIQQARGSAGFLAAEGRSAFQFLAATS